MNFIHSGGFQWIPVSFRWSCLVDSSGLHFYFTLQKSPGQDSLADSTGHTSLDSRRVQSGTVRHTVQSSPVRHSPATYIRYVCCMFLESGPVRRSPLDTSLDSRRVQSGTAVRRIPLDTPLWTPLPFLTPEESSPAQSSGVQQTDHVTICDPSGSTVTPVESSGVRRTVHVTICDPSGLRIVRRSPVGHVGQCKVLP